MLQYCSPSRGSSGWKGMSPALRLLVELPSMSGREEETDATEGFLLHFSTGVNSSTVTGYSSGTGNSSWQGSEWRHTQRTQKHRQTQTQNGEGGREWERERERGLTETVFYLHDPRKGHGSWSTAAASLTFNDGTKSQFTAFNKHNPIRFHCLHHTHTHAHSHTHTHTHTHTHFLSWTGRQSITGCLHHVNYHYYFIFFYILKKFNSQLFYVF